MVRYNSSLRIFRLVEIKSQSARQLTRPGPDLGQLPSYDDCMWIPPTRDGRTHGTDPQSGLTWAIEAPDTHWAEHDVRLVAYWRSRPAAERMAEAAAYRVRVHGLVAAPAQWTWQLVPAGKDVR